MQEIDLDDIEHILLKGMNYNKHGVLVQQVQLVCMTQVILTLLIWRHTINIF